MSASPVVPVDIHEWSSGCGTPEDGSVVVAEWKTSDFVVTLIKEQQVPVCLSAQAELFSLRLLSPAKIRMYSHFCHVFVTDFFLLFIQLQENKKCP
ncbi:hypothetical protein F2P81_000687 [Xyrichtys novacula]|uniref:Uncharacterized protein n=1 Tax=Xyrichtys novacula TaxID=13765 RepID=A0AAV1GHQ6_XYRNO|nr:hypothetical protein F2P81_000687 [Xyrichtys novacula]